MKRRILACLLLIAVVLSLCSCTNTSASCPFRVTFIDVGQGDSALIECEGCSMLIDGGDFAHGDDVFKILKDRNILDLDILVASHLDADHIGGLTKVLSNISGVDLVLSNENSNNTEIFRKFEQKLKAHNQKIVIPEAGDQYHLGSAIIDVIAVQAGHRNNSLVLMITYGETKFLFTGDIQDDMQKGIADQYGMECIQTDQYPHTVPEKINVMKMPHHGAECPSLYRFMWTFMPEYAVISVGAHNSNGHPDQNTIRMLENMKNKSPRKYRMKDYFRTDICGSIIIESNGRKIQVVRPKGN